MRHGLLLACILPLAAQAVEGLDRDYTVIVSHTYLVGIVPPQAPPLVCSEDGDDRTPTTDRTPAKADNPIRLEDRWTSTGRAPVICRQGARVVLTVPAPRGQAEREGQVDLDHEDRVHVQIVRD